MVQDGNGGRVHISDRWQAYLSPQTHSVSIIIALLLQQSFTPLSLITNILLIKHNFM